MHSFRIDGGKKTPHKFQSHLRDVNAKRCYKWRYFNDITKKLAHQMRMEERTSKNKNYETIYILYKWRNSR